jgi:hypothetical protein
MKKKVYTEQFIRLSKNVHDLHWRLYRALSAFCVFEEFQRLLSPRHVGKKRANAHAEIMSQFKSFFIPIREGSRMYFLIELGKFFDANPRALSVPGVIRDLKAHYKGMHKENFLEFRREKGNPVSEEIAEGYTPPSGSDIKYIEDALRRIEPLSIKIWKYRSQWLAHDENKRAEIKITAGEIKRVFRLLSRILNRLSVRIDWSTTDNRTVEECRKETTQVISCLIDCEKRRLEEVALRWS